MGDEEKQKGTQEENPSIKPAMFLKKKKNVENDKNKTNAKSNYAKKEIQEMLFFWRNKTFGQKRDIILIIVNIVLAAIATTSLILVYFMTSEQNQLSRDALGRADKNLKIAEETLDVNKTAMITANTPYLKIKPKMLQLNPDTIDLKITFTNVGETPALALHVNLALAQTPPHDSLVAHEPKTPIGSILAPNDSVYISFLPEFLYGMGEATYSKIVSGVFTFKLAGAIGYEDVFGYKYRIDFFYVYDLKRERFIVPGKKGWEYKRLKE